MDAADTEALIRTLLASGESYYVEFKSAWDYGPEGKAPRDLKLVARDIGEALVAFANSDGGDLLVGVEDSGSLTGVPWEGDKLLYLLQSPRHQVKEADIGARVIEASVDGHCVLLFRVPEYPGEPVVTSDGRCVWRTGKRTELSIPAAAP
jgi:ATP-dependent DNA helicase RecG